MKKVIRKVMTIAGVLMVIIGGCGIDSNVRLAIEMIIVGAAIASIGMREEKHYAECHR